MVAPGRPGACSAVTMSRALPAPAAVPARSCQAIPDRRRHAFLAGVLALCGGLLAPISGVAKAGGAAVATGAVGGMEAGGAGAASFLDERYFHRSWRRSDGLPGTSVYAIAQTADGFLWVGTENGLGRFDGRRFTTFGAAAQGFRSRFVAALLAGADGSLWIGTERGLLRWHGGEVGRDGLPGSLLAEAAVSALAQDPGGDLWVGTRSGIVRRDARSGKATLIGLDGLRVVYLLAGAAGEVWIGTESHGLWRYGGGRLAQVAADPGLRQESVGSLVRDHDGSVLCFTASGGRRFRGGRLIASGVAASPGRAGDPLTARQVSAVELTAAGVWLATADRGLEEIAGGRRWSAHPDQPMAQGMIFKIFVAADRSVWFGAAGDGLHQLVEKSCRTYTRRDGLVNNALSSLQVDGNGTIWLGTLGGVSRLSPAATAGAGSYTARTSLAGNSVMALLRDRGGMLWAGTETGLARYAGGRWRFLPRWGDPATQSISGLYEDAPGNLWLAAAGGLGMLAAGRSRQVVMVKGLEGQVVTDLAEADDGSLWIGTRGAGLLRLAHGRLERLLPAAQVPIVTAIQRGGAGEMWVGTFGNGLLHFRSGSWHRLDEASGLADNTVRQLIDDPRGDLWVCSGAGIDRIGKAEIAAVEAGRATALLSRPYGAEDGVAEGVCYFGHPGAALGADGRVWFATNRGLVEIRPQAPRLAPPRPVMLEEVTTDGRTLAGDRAARLTLPGSVRRIGIRFSMPLFVGRPRMPLRYRLAGFESEWTPTEGMAQFTSLPPGHYRFEVSRRDRLTGWAPPEMLAEVEVEPLFYHRWSFLVLAALALAGAAFAVHRWAQRRLLRRAAALEEQVAQRTEALRQANRQLEALATSDALTGLANRRRLQEALEQELRRAARGGREISLVMIDVDFFKRYNDTLGHVSGDACLRQVAAALRDGVSRSGDLVARYGGEEFAVLLPDTPAPQAQRVAESLRRAVVQLAMPHPGSQAALYVTISAGVVSLVPPPGFSPAELVEAADEALYRAKAAGRNCVQTSRRPRRGVAAVAAVGAVGAVAVASPRSAA